MNYLVWNVDPVWLDLGQLQLYWYGLFFIGAYFAGMMISRWIYMREGRNINMFANLLIYGIVGGIVGARLIHCLVYEPHYYLSHPLEILMVWKSGRASFGLILGIIVAFWLYGRKYHESFLWLFSRMTIPVLVVFAFIRFGNFFNSEVIGKVTDVPWAVIFERVDLLPRHPVQLYEAFSYLIMFVLFVMLYKKISSSSATCLLPGLFLVSLFTIRFLLEYTKDVNTLNLPLISGLTSSQVLCLPFILIGITWIIWNITITRKIE